MRSLRRAAGVVGLLASQAYAQVKSSCATNDVCFKINIPANTASSGTGDIFFQISAPSTYEWVALGQGTSMSGSNIFVVYTAGNGNVTISPRLGQGERMPNFNSNAQVTLLDGSGVSNGKMVANVKCSSCNTWSGGSASFTDSNGKWIWAQKNSGGPKDSSSQSATIAQHDSHGAFTWDYTDAKGGSSINPLVNAPSGAGTATNSGATVSCVPRPTGSAASRASGSVTAGPGNSAATATSSAGDDDNRSRGGRPTQFPFGTAFPTAFPSGRPPNSGDDESQFGKRDVTYCDEIPGASSGLTPVGGVTSAEVQKTKRMLAAHGAMAALAFVIFFPTGAITIRLAAFAGVVWLHAALQALGFLIYIVAFGLGVYIASELDLLTEAHPIIGIVIFALLFLQPITGLLHHSLFKKHQARTASSHAHLWLGRILITLGIINGGLGFQLAQRMNWSSRSAEIAYAVIAAVMWLLWVLASVFDESRRRRAVGGARQSKDVSSPPNGERDGRGVSSDVPPPPQGHYGPKA